MIQQQQQQQRGEASNAVPRQLTYHFAKVFTLAVLAIGGVAFSFEEEKFRLIYWPPTAKRFGGSLYQCGGYLAMATGLVDLRIKLWVLDKYVPESPPSKSVHAWTLHLICIPYDFADLRYCLLGNLPTGEMLMAGAEQEEIHGSKSPVSPFYSYNPTKGTLKPFVTDNKFPSSVT